MNVIAAEEKYIPLIAEIERDSFYTPWSENSLASALDDSIGIFLAAMDGDSCAGYIIGVCDGMRGYIERIAVSPKLRRQGIGKLLLDEFEKALPESTSLISLDVRASNEAARRLYAKCGYEAAAVRRNLYDAPREDGIVMIKNIGSE